MTETQHVTPLSDAEMRAAGFTDHSIGHWYMCRTLIPNTTFNLSIDKETGSYREDVLDEFFGQPEYYGRMKPAIRDKVIASIDSILAELAAIGIVVVVDHRAYGVEL